MEIDVKWCNEYAEVKVQEGYARIETGFLDKKEREELIMELEYAIEWLKD